MYKICVLRAIEYIKGLRCAKKSWKSKFYCTRYRYIYTEILSIILHRVLSKLNTKSNDYSFNSGYNVLYIFCFQFSRFLVITNFLCEKWVKNNRDSNIYFLTYIAVPSFMEIDLKINKKKIDLRFAFEELALSTVCEHIRQIPN